MTSPVLAPLVPGVQAFGTASTGEGYGVTSYAQFTAENNNENQNRERLLDRTLKQAFSTGLFMLGIPRCSNPFCGRAYPSSVQEQDQKDDELCDECKENLEAHLAQIRSCQYSLRIDGYIKQKKPDLAIAECLKALKLYKDDVNILRKLGILYSDKGELDQALSTFEKALKVFPDNHPDSHNDLNSLGYANYLKKNHEKAVEFYKRALAINDKEGLYHYNLALAYYALGEYALAKESLAKAKANGYEGSPQFAEMLELQ